MLPPLFIYVHVLLDQNGSNHLSLHVLALGMCEEPDEYASNIRKLHIMGFGDDLQLKEALSSCENDIDSAITFLVNVFSSLYFLIIRFSNFKKTWINRISSPLIVYFLRFAFF